MTLFTTHDDIHRSPYTVSPRLHSSHCVCVCVVTLLMQVVHPNESEEEVKMELSLPELRDLISKLDATNKAINELVG